jgi:hypothetical protein
LKLAQPGNPIEVIHLYRDYDGNAGMSKPGEFLVPLIYDNEVRVFITVAFFRAI